MPNRFTHLNEAFLPRMKHNQSHHDLAQSKRLIDAALLMQRDFSTIT